MNAFKYKPDKNHSFGEEERLPVDQLYPELSPDERAEAEYFLNRFLEVMHRIFEQNQRNKRD